MSGQSAWWLKMTTRFNFLHVSAGMYWLPHTLHQQAWSKGHLIKRWYNDKTPCINHPKACQITDTALVNGSFEDTSVCNTINYDWSRLWHMPEVGNISLWRTFLLQLNHLRETCQMNSWQSLTGCIEFLGQIVRKHVISWNFHQW